MLALSSWDKKRAFDSVSRNLSKMALVRIGVPREIAEYIVAHDEDGHTIIRSSYSLGVMKEIKNRAITEGKSYTDPACDPENKMIYFNGQRGCGQRDVSSTTIWPCSYDILVYAIEDVMESDHEEESSEDNCDQVESDGEDVVDGTNSDEQYLVNGENFQLV